MKKLWILVGLILLISWHSASYPQSVAYGIANPNTVHYAISFSGSTPDVQIANCLADLGVRGGTCSTDGLTGTFAAALTISQSNVKLVLGTGAKLGLGSLSPAITVTGNNVSIVGGGTATLSSTAANKILIVSGTGDSISGVTFVDNATSGINRQFVVTANASNFTIEDCWISSTSAKPIGLVSAVGGTGIKVLNNHCIVSNAATHVALLTGGTSGYTTANDVATSGGNGTGLALDIVASGGVVTSVSIYSGGGQSYHAGDVVNVSGGSGDATVEITTINASGQCIVVTNLTGAEISGNSSSGYGIGIQWWGGNASGSNGVLTNPRQVGKLAITGNVSNGGSIWGSMGDGIEVTDNAINGCPDVCLDPEGSFNVIASDNHVADGVNGALSTFFQNRNVVFSGNTVLTHNHNWPLVRLADQELSPVQNIDTSMVGNTFTNLDTTGIGTIQTFSSTTEEFHFEDNTIRNANFVYTFDVIGLVVSGNEFIFDQAFPSAGQAIYVFRGNQRTPSTIGPASILISKNKVISNVAQPSGSAAICVQFGDYAHAATGVATIDGNTMGGTNPFPVDIRAVAGTRYGSSPGQQFIIRNNLLASSNILTQRINGNNTAYFLVDRSSPFREPRKAR